MEAQTEYRSGLAPDGHGVWPAGSVQPGSSNVMKSAALFVLNSVLPRICGMVCFSQAFPAETSSQL